MSKFHIGQIVTDARGRIGVIVSFFKTKFGNYYNVLIEGEISSLPEEDLEPKH